MYRLQYALAFDKDGNNIPAQDLEWKDTVFEYEDREDANEDRITMQMQCNDKYIRVVEFD
jgi:hypothetical protein